MSSTFGTHGQVQPLLEPSIAQNVIKTLQDQGGKVTAEYVWIGGSGSDLRSKSKCGTLNHTNPITLCAD
jgi:glutamine synthetase